MDLLNLIANGNSNNNCYNDEFISITDCTDNINEEENINHNDNHDKMNFKEKIISEGKMNQSLLKNIKKSKLCNNNIALRRSPRLNPYLRNKRKEYAKKK